jgi:hypothetical protein
MKPFKCDLKSALSGTRLMRSLLEIISSNAVQSFHQLEIFLKQTLKYTLQTKQRCELCKRSFEGNQSLFSEKPEEKVL